MPAEYDNDNDNGNSYEDIDSTDFKELSKFFFKAGVERRGLRSEENQFPKYCHTF